MKTIKIFSVTVLFLSVCSFAFAQNKKETFKVSGECGMCKNKIEKAAKEAGATYANWNTETKMLTVKYRSSSSNAAKIQQSIAGVGYDTPGFKATEDAYNNLHACCKYERDDASNKASCCSDKCEMKDGKCADMSKCKEQDCCKDMEACKAHGCCGEKMSGDAKMNCCKDGKCSMPGHKGGDCCKKS